MNYALCEKGPTPPWCVGGVLELQKTMTDKMIGRRDKVLILTGQKNAENGSVKCTYTLELIHNPQLHAGQTPSHLCSVSAKNKKKNAVVLPKAAISSVGASAGSSRRQTVDVLQLQTDCFSQYAAAVKGRVFLKER